MMTKFIPINYKTSLTPIGSSFGIWPSMIDRYVNQPFVSDSQFMNATFKVNIEETEKTYLIEAEMPGIHKEEVVLNIDENDNLLISVKSQEKEANNERHYIYKERGIRAMSRRIGLVDAKLDEIRAKLENGILFITVPKKTQVTNRRQIDIE